MSWNQASELNPYNITRTCLKYLRFCFKLTRCFKGLISLKHYINSSSYIAFQIPIKTNVWATQLNIDRWAGFIFDRTICWFVIMDFYLLLAHEVGILKHASVLISETRTYRHTVLNKEYIKKKFQKKKLLRQQYLDLEIGRLVVLQDGISG